MVSPLLVKEARGRYIRWEYLRRNGLRTLHLDSVTLLEIGIVKISAEMCRHTVL